MRIGRFTGWALGLMGCGIFAAIVGAAAGEAEVDGGPVRVLAFGDSLTAGYGLEPEFSYPARLEVLAARDGYNLEVRNAGLSGETTAGGVRRLGWVLRQEVDVLILALGANDALRALDPESTRANLQTIIDQAYEAHPEVLIVLAGMLAPPNLGEAYGEAFNRVFEEIETANPGLYRIPFLLEGVAGDPTLNQRDRIHPTAKGQEVVAETVWKHLRRALDGRAAEAR